MPMQQMPQYGAKPAGADKKILAGILGIVLGGLGIHKFVLGYNQEGVILIGVYLVSIVIAMVTCGIGAVLRGGLPDQSGCREPESVVGRQLRG